MLAIIYAKYAAHKRRIVGVTPHIINILSSVVRRQIAKRGEEDLKCIMPETK